MKTPLQHITGLLLTLTSIVVSAQIPTSDRMISPQTNEIIPPSPSSAQQMRYQSPQPSLATGAVNLSIPLYTLEVEGVAIPFTMTYHTSGIKPLDDPFPCGYGWSLQPALRVTRTVRGRPDEQFRYVGDSIAGGLHFTDKRVAFACMVSNSPGHTSTIRERLDAEKDIFTISLPTTTLTRIVQKRTDGQYSFLGGGADDEYTISAQGNKFETITVTDPYGVIYIFGGEYGGRYVESPQPSYPDVTAMITSWGLREIVLPSGRNITFDWTTFSPHEKGIFGGDAIGDMFDPFSSRYTPEEIKVTARHGLAVNPRGNYNLRIRLASVKFPGGEISLSYNDCMLQSFTVKSGSDIVKKAELKYNLYKYDLYFLKELTLSGEGTYGFEYNPFNVENKLPITSSVLYNIDWWGYYNGRTPQNGKGYTSLSPRLRLNTHPERARDYSRYEYVGEADRRPDADSMQAGILRKIIYPTGGLSTFDYEPHRFAATKVDSHGNIDASTDPYLDFGGGLRVKRIATYAEPNDRSPQIRTYVYDSVVVTAVPSAATFVSVVEHAIGLYSDPNLYIQPHSYRFTTVRHESDYMNNHIGEEAIWYRKVTEIFSEGKIEYVFKQTCPTSSEQRFWGKLFPQELNNIFSNGIRLREKRTYKSNGTSFRKIETEIHGYEITGGSRVLNSYFTRDYIQAAVDESEAPDFCDAETFSYYSDINQDHPRMFYLSEVIGSENPYIGQSYTMNLISDRLRAKTVTQHLDNGDFSQTETYTYKPGTSIITSVSTSTPGDTRTSRIDIDYAVSGRNSAETAMVRANAVGIPVKTTLTFGTATTAVRREMQSYGNRVFRPMSEWMSRGTTEWRVGQYDYDAFGNVREYRGADSVPSVYLWGYEGRHPVYRIDGASFAEVKATNPDLYALNGTAEKALLSSSLSDRLVTKALWRPMVGIISLQQPSGITTTYSYDDAGRLTQTAIKGHGPVDSYSYHVNDGGYNYMTHGVFTSATATSGSTREVINYDGLGREISRLSRAPDDGSKLISGLMAADAQTDAVLPPIKLRPTYTAVMTEYDDMDRAARQWSTTGVYNIHPRLSDVSADAAEHYGTDYAYSSIFYEPSPRGVVASTRKAGTEWHDADRRVTVRTLTNTASGDYSCYKYSSASETRTTLTRQIYPSGTLLIEETVDEEGHTTMVFKDVRGLTVMMREGSSGDWLDTRYVYDDYGDLRWVIQPKQTQSSVQKNKCFRYSYDERGRCTFKALPECEGTSYYYDSRNRLIAEQDGNMKADGRWLVHLYDRFGRKAFSSMANATEAQIKALMADKSYTPLGPWQGAYLRGAHGGYWLSSFPLKLDKLVSATYYDNYDFSYDLTGDWYDYRPPAGHASPRKNVKGMVTGTLHGKYVTVFSYDDSGRAIRTASGWSHDILESITAQRLDYEGKVIEELREDRIGKTPLSRRTVNDYFSSGYLHRQTIYQGNDTAKAEYGYDDAGRLSAVTFADDIKRTQQYNANGWLTEIDVEVPLSPIGIPIRPITPITSLSSATAEATAASVSSSKSTETLHYADGGTDYTARYDGKISAREDDTGLSAYSYDIHGRLTEVKDNNDLSNFSSSYEYDNNSNILSITRKGISDYITAQTRPGGLGGLGGFKMPKYGVHNEITLNYSSYGNRLNSAKVTRDGADYEGRTGLAATDGTVTGFAYDANGNLTKDPTRDIVLIKYNHLNLPVDVYFGNGQRQTIEYLGNGAKHSVCYSQTSASIVGGNVPADDRYSVTSTRTYVGPHVFEDGNLEYSAFDGGYFDPEGGTMYYLTDWQGNNVEVLNAKCKTQQTVHYYPYGEPTKEPSGQRFLYGGKEREHAGGRNSYDFSARCLISPLGQWGVPDQLGEKTPWQSIYSYCGGDPINYIDPDGKETICVSGDKAIRTYAANVIDDPNKLTIYSHGHYTFFDDITNSDPGHLKVNCAQDFIDCANYNFQSIEDIRNEIGADIVIKACLTGGCNPKGGENIAQKISRALPNAFITAPTGEIKTHYTQLNNETVTDLYETVIYRRDGQEFVIPANLQYNTYFRGIIIDPQLKDVIKQLLRCQNIDFYRALMNMLTNTLENLHADESKIDL